MRRLKDYFSYSELNKWESSPRQYWLEYGLGEDPYESEAMSKGREFMEYLQFGFCDDPDPLLPQVAKEISTLDIIEEVVKVDGPPKLLARLDTSDASHDVIGEYKTGKIPWTQEMVDEADQLLFYATLLYHRNGKIPDAFLEWVQTEETEFGELRYTGNVYHFDTSFSKRQINSMGKRIEKAINDIANYQYSEYIVNNDLAKAYVKLKSDLDAAQASLEIVKNEIDNRIFESGEQYGWSESGIFTVNTRKTGVKYVTFKPTKINLK